jgi:bifunctional non-homologous end joining protein LigD
MSESFSDAGSTLLQHACKMGLEGIVSKVADAPYRSGRSHDWIKTKCSDRQELVVAGVVPSTADARAVGALVLGFYERGKLHYAGRTGTGFTHEIARSLFRKLKALETAKARFRPRSEAHANRSGLSQEWWLRLISMAGPTATV